MAMGGGGTYQPVPAIPRLGISEYQYDTECLHGIKSLDTTAFPQALGLAASFRFALRLLPLSVSLSLETCVLPPSYGRYTGQPAFAGTPVKNWRILLKQSLTAHIPLLTATSIFRLRRRH